MGQTAMTSDEKLDLLHRAVFGSVNEETLEQSEGLLTEVKHLDKKLNVVMYGGAFSSAIIVLHFLGAPTQTIWGLASKAALMLIGSP